MLTACSGSLPASAPPMSAVRPQTAAASREATLYRFLGRPDGAGPAAGLIADAAGAFYGMTVRGGAYNSGAVYKLTPKGSSYSESLLYSFKGVFALSPSGGGYRERVLYGFDRSADGLYPTDGLLLDGSGALYGTTSFGGHSDKGTVFELKPSERAYAERVLYSFKGRPDGFGPNGGLIFDASETLYGTTQNGGSGCGTGCGTVFSLRRRGAEYAETVLHSFRGHRDGAFPDGGLRAGKGGELYGVTGDGGSLRCHHSGCGTVYQFTPLGSYSSERVLYAFKGGNDGQIPLGTLVNAGRGRLYGVTGFGGVRGNGLAFSVML
jgi:uncharacterized repeat protein (TIGR03803 family)